MPDPRFLDATAKANWRATGVPSDNTRLRALSRHVQCRVDPAAHRYLPVPWPVGGTRALRPAATRRPSALPGQRNGRW